MDCTKLLVSVQYTVHSIKLQHLFYTHSLTFNTQVGVTSRTSSTQVRRAFLAKYWSCRHTPRSFSTLQNLRYSGYLLCAFLASSAALPTRNVRGREVTHGEQKQCGPPRLVEPPRSLTLVPTVGAAAPLPGKYRSK